MNLSRDERRRGGVLVNRISKLSARVFQELLESRGIDSLPPGQGRILFTLLGKDGITLKELAIRTGLDKSGLSLTLRRMEKAGTVRLETSQEDGRSIQIRLTEQAQGMRAIHEAVSEEMVQIFYRGFTGEEIDFLEKSLERILGNLEGGGVRPAEPDVLNSQK